MSQRPDVHQRDRRVGEERAQRRVRHGVDPVRRCGLDQPAAQDPALRSPGSRLSDDGALSDDGLQGLAQGFQGLGEGVFGGRAVADDQTVRQLPGGGGRGRVAEPVQALDG